jgi:hypothetical protein
MAPLSSHPETSATFLVPKFHLGTHPVSAKFHFAPISPHKTYPSYETHRLASMDYVAYNFKQRSPCSPLKANTRTDFFAKIRS